MGDFRCLQDSCTWGDVFFEVGYHKLCDIGLEVFEERVGEGGAVDLVVVDADIVGEFIGCWETLLHEGEGLDDLEGIFNSGSEGGELF